MFLDHIHLVQDSLLHSCNEYCLENVKRAGIKLMSCRFGFGTEATSNLSDPPEKELCKEAVIEKDHREFEHLLLPRCHSKELFSTVELFYKHGEKMPTFNF